MLCAICNTHYNYVTGLRESSNNSNPKSVKLNPHTTLAKEVDDLPQSYMILIDEIDRLRPSPAHIDTVLSAIVKKQPINTIARLYSNYIIQCNLIKRYMVVVSKLYAHITNKTVTIAMIQETIDIIKSK